MPLSQIQQQKLEQQQQQKLTHQQLIALRLLEMPIARLEEDIEAVMDDNPALEKDFSYENDTLYDNENENESESEAESATVPDNSLSGATDPTLSDVLFDLDDDNHQDYSSSPIGEFTPTDSAGIDNLMDQLRETVLTDTERTIMEYLIGSLDSDGLLRKDIDIIVDELAIYNYIDTTEEEVTKILHKLQTFDPAGIGAQTLQECLLLQIDRLPHSDMHDMMRTVITDHYDEFMKKHWDKIQSSLHIDADDTAMLMKALRKLNPKPGSSINESVTEVNDQITPDIIIEKDEEGNVTFSINRGNMPELKVSDDYLDELHTYEKMPDSQSNRSMREAKAYYKEKVEKANWYIEALRQRYRTMTLCTRAILQWQKRYFVDGDEAELRPMVLRDIAEKTGLDISTVSRYSNQKYAETPWGIKSMRFFFTDGYTNEDGEEMATRKIRLKLKEIIDAEDKKKPLSDEALTKAMAAAGFPVARRTITKYREKLGIPVARLRK